MFSDGRIVRLFVRLVKRDASERGLTPELGRRRGCQLQATNAARDEQKAEATNPGPACEWIRNFGKTEMSSKRDEKQDQANHPDSHCWSFTDVAHSVPQRN